MTFTKLEFTSETLPDGNAIEVMKDYLGREICHIEINLPEGATEIDYRLDLHVSETAKWGYWTQLAATHERTDKLREDGNDDVILTMADVPILMRSPGMEDFVVKTGDLLVLSQARSAQFTLPRAARGWSVRLPHRILHAAIPDLDEAPLRGVSRQAPGMFLLRSYVQATAQERFDDPSITAMAARHLQDLIALVLRGGDRHGGETVPGLVSSSRRKVIEADMLAHLGKPNLDLEWIAARQGVSVRHVQRLFASQGTSFSDELRRMRLEKAVAALSDERNADRTILSIAMDLGFLDAPTFNRSFKRHFGFTPGEMRPRR
jgi:AraC-like DNA-binding protein